MQMMKNEKGITLVSLMVTVIVMVIIAGIGIGSVYTGMDSFNDNTLNTELGIVRQVVIEQYQKARIVNKLEVSKDDTKVNFWVGEKIESTNNLGFTATITSQNYQEDYYYRLNPDMLAELGLKDAKHTYIVNYKTGEVYNETVKKYSDGNLLYLGPINYDEEKTEDITSFNNWEN